MVSDDEQLVKNWFMMVHDVLMMNDGQQLENDSQ